MYSKEGTNHQKRSQIKTDQKGVCERDASDKCIYKKKGTNHQKKSQIRTDQERFCGTDACDD
jgi:hypothetical protein